MAETDLRYHRCNPNKRYEDFDARGISIGFVCDICREAKRGMYREDVFTDSDYWHDEPIEED